MFPTDEQIRVAAYHRWQRRGHDHGRHDADWLAAEQDLRLALNYRVLAQHAQGAPPAAEVLGDPYRPVCRFCEQAAPRTRFRGTEPALPESLPVPGPLAADQCEECRSQFDEELADPLRGLIDACRAGAPPATVPVAVFRALVRCALAVLPADELDLFPDALEWSANPDDDAADETITGLGVTVHVLERRQSPWSALARKADDAAPMPHLIAFFGLDTATIELPMPLCLRDDDLDGGEVVVPQVPTLDGLTRDPGPFAPHRLAVARPAPRRRGRMLNADWP